MSAADGESMAAHQGGGGFLPGRVEDTLERTPGDIHLRRSLILGEALHIAEAQGLHFLHGNGNPALASLGGKFPAGRLHANAPAFWVSGHKQLLCQKNLCICTI